MEKYRQVLIFEKAQYFVLSDGGITMSSYFLFFFKLKQSDG